MTEPALACITRFAAAARAEAARMAEAVGDSADDATVRMSAAQFRQLARLLGGLAEAGSACGGSDCMGAAVDGIRTWVTRDRLDRERADKDRAIAAARRLGAAERARVTAERAAYSLSDSAGFAFD